MTKSPFRRLKYATAHNACADLVSSMAKKASKPRKMYRGRAYGQVCGECGITNPVSIKWGGRLYSECHGQPLEMVDDKMSEETGR